ncbi:FtsB family cell division protein [Candidatus Paracaedibacter symbiosus]|uniref:FtsB family cell division protein n=1 Tax=Candidatus Paracaedibacter symbiosus TaxID=244582 RepID=UPI00050953E3|nr:septum formation initiator family protein [Candidatus Paracaedibacter symbiosus]
MRTEFSRRFQQVVGPLISITLLGYFVYHIIQGERGLLSWMRLKQKIQTLEQKLTSVQEEQSQLEQRVYLLRPDSLDRDMLEEQARKILNYANTDELIIHDSELVKE